MVDKLTEAADNRSQLARNMSGGLESLFAGACCTVLRIFSSSYYINPKEILKLFSIGLRKLQLGGGVVREPFLCPRIYLEILSAREIIMMRRV